jgi:hypothetical protein
MLLEVLHAEVQITPEEKESGGFDAGFEQFDRIGRSKDEAADDESRGCSDKERPTQGTEFEGVPGKWALEQTAADGTKRQTGEEQAHAHHQLIGEEAFEVRIAEFRGLADIGEDEKDGDEAKTTATNGLKEPEGGNAEINTPDHGGILAYLV